MENGKYTAVVTVMDNETYETKSFDIQFDDGMVLVGDRGECVVGILNPVTLYEMVGDVVTAFTAEHYREDKRGECAVCGLIGVIDTIARDSEDDIDPRIFKAVEDATGVISKVIDEKISEEIEKRQDILDEVLESDSIDEQLKQAIRDYMKDKEYA